MKKKNLLGVGISGVERVIETWVSDIPQYHGEVGFGQVEHCFFAKYLPYLTIFHGAPKVLRNFEKSSNVAKICAKNEENLCSTSLKTIFRLISGTQKSD